MNYKPTSLEYLMFHSFAEQVFFSATIAFALIHVIYVQFVTRSKSLIAMLVDHKRTQAYATLYLRVGHLGYLLGGMVILAIYVVVLCQYEWFATAAAAAVIAVSMMIATVRKFRSLDEADLAEAQHFMDYDLKQSSFKFRIR